MKVENDKVAEKDYLDLLDISVKVGEEEDNQLFQWVRPLHLDDENGNPNPWIVAHVWEIGVDVEQVLFEEVHTNSFNQDTRFISIRNFSVDNHFSALLWLHECWM